MKKLFQAISLILLITLYGCPIYEPLPPHVYDVGIFYGTGAEEASVLALKELLVSNEYKVIYLSDRDIERGDFYTCGMVLFPNGDANEMGLSFSEVGTERIRRYVNAGNGLLGIGGGAEICDSSKSFPAGIGVFHGVANSPVDGVGSHGNEVVTTILSTSPSHPLSVSDSLMVTYKWGPDFFTTSNIVNIIYVYKQTQTPAVITTNYGEGRVVLFGVCPEMPLSETSPNNTLQEEMILQAVRWIYREF